MASTFFDQMTELLRTQTPNNVLNTLADVCFHTHKLLNKKNDRRSAAYWLRLANHVRKCADDSTRLIRYT